MVKRFLQNAHPLTLGAVGFSFIGIPAIIYLFTTDFLSRANIPSFNVSLIGIISLSFSEPVIASIGSYALIQRTDAPISR
ncbi:MAG: hypothetical protein IPL12_21555 [Bacteroidetes bacterium]|nr:hypothetical protein [Bacteroidota bacterium]